jgi:hypothetical protein
MAKPTYVYDRTGRVVQLAEPEPLPSLPQIRSWLQTPLGVSAASSILTTNESNELDKLIVTKIEKADLDGGDF